MNEKPSIGNEILEGVTLKRFINSQISVYDRHTSTATRSHRDSMLDSMHSFTPHSPSPGGLSLDGRKSAIGVDILSYVLVRINEDLAGPNLEDSLYEDGQEKPLPQFYIVVVTGVQCLLFRMCQFIQEAAAAAALINKPPQAAKRKKSLVSLWRRRKSTKDSPSSKKVDRKPSEIPVPAVKPAEKKLKVPKSTKPGRRSPSNLEEKGNAKRSDSVAGGRSLQSDEATPDNAKDVAPFEFHSKLMETSLHLAEYFIIAEIESAVCTHLTHLSFIRFIC